MFLKRFTKTAVLILAAAIAVLMFGCKDGDSGGKGIVGGGGITASSIAGTWRNTADPGETYTFNANGTGTWTYYGEQHSFTFTVRGNTVTATAYNDPRQLVFASDGESFTDPWGDTFTRASGGGGGGRDSRLVNAANEAWVECHYFENCDWAIVFRSNGNFEQLFKNSGVWVSIDNGTWSTNSGNTAITLTSPFFADLVNAASLTASYTVSGNTVSIDLDRSGQPYIFTRTLGVSVGGGGGGNITASAIAGTWRNTADPTEAYVFNANGTGTWVYDDDQYSLTFTISGNTVTLTEITTESSWTIVFASNGNSFTDSYGDTFTKSSGGDPPSLTTGPNEAWVNIYYEEEAFLFLDGGEFVILEGNGSVFDPVMAGRWSLSGNNIVLTMKGVELGAYPYGFEGDVLWIDFDLNGIPYYCSKVSGVTITGLSKLRDGAVKIGDGLMRGKAASVSKARGGLIKSRDKRQNMSAPAVAAPPASGKTARALLDRYK